MATQQNTVYDYENQAWIVDGRYVACGHGKASTDGKCWLINPCYGSAHAGEPVPAERMQAILAEVA